MENAQLKEQLEECQSEKDKSEIKLKEILETATLIEKEKTDMEIHYVSYNILLGTL